MKDTHKVDSHPMTALQEPLSVEPVVRFGQPCEPIDGCPVPTSSLTSCSDTYGRLRRQVGAKVAPDSATFSAKVAPDSASFNLIAHLSLKVRQGRITYCSEKAVCVQVRACEYMFKRVRYMFKRVRCIRQKTITEPQSLFVFVRGNILSVIFLKNQRNSPSRNNFRIVCDSITGDLVNFEQCVKCKALYCVKKGRYRDSE